MRSCLQPFKLLAAEIAEAAGLQIHDVDEADEVHAVGVERVPAGALGAAAVALAVELDLFVEEIVLAGHVMHVELGLRDDAFGVVEFGRLRQMADVAGVDHEGRLDRHRLDLADRLFKRAERIRVGRLVEADMAVADLQEGQAGRLGACAEPTSPSERGTPPEMVQSTPVPAQVMHSSTRRRLTPRALIVVIVIELAHCRSPSARDWACGDVIGGARGLFLPVCAQGPDSAWRR